MKPTDALPHPADWNTAVIGDAIEIKRGVSWSKEQEHATAHEGTVPVIGISNVQDRLELGKLLWLTGLKPKTIEKKRVQKGWSVMVGSNGNRQRIGNAVFVEQDAEFLFASFLLAAKPKGRSGITAEFFYRWLRSEQVQSYLSASSEGSTGLSNLSQSFFREMTIAFPEDGEQSTITRVLDAVDAVIVRAQEALQSAVVLRRALISDLLSVGVDDNGQIRSPKVGGFDFVSTPIGVVPAAWHVSDVGTEFEIQSGITLNEAQRIGQRRWRYLRVANVHRDTLALHDVQTLLARESEVAARLLKQGDLLIVEGHADRRQIGRCALATEASAGMTFQNHLYRLRTHGAVNPAFGCLWLNSIHSQRYWNAMCGTSSGLNTINQRMLKRLRIAVPSPTEQERVVAMADAAAANTTQLESKTKTLRELKRSLMHDLLTGLVRLHPAQFKREAAE
jgi:type I restriction enzyme S subunit